MSHFRYVAITHRVSAVPILPRVINRSGHVCILLIPIVIPRTFPTAFLPVLSVAVPTLFVLWDAQMKINLSTGTRRLRRCGVFFLLLPLVARGLFRFTRPYIYIV